ncbi:hypothetical protein Lal_00035959 [Lupinus albus]|nr:hypothetical protein Lal_00035959 [Lupinus albus]
MVHLGGTTVRREMGRNKMKIGVHLHPISYRILNKMATWKGSTLPIMGTVELVKSILDGMLV